jgi:hypothetical protein
MSDRAWAATRKGLFELRRVGALWRVERVSFLGEPVTMLLAPQADGRMLAALNLGHFGVKLHASDDAGVHWREVSVPTYPPQPDGATGPAWKLVQVWSLAMGAAGRVWAGTLPGGLFWSDDFGSQWSLCEALWQQPGRSEWFGGGYDVPGIHSLCPHAQRPGTRCCWASAPAAPGRPPTTAAAGSSARAECVRPTCRPSAPKTPTCRTRT